MLDLNSLIYYNSLIYCQLGTPFWKFGAYISVCMYCCKYILWKFLWSITVLFFPYMECYIYLFFRVVLSSWETLTTQKMKFLLRKCDQICSSQRKLNSFADVNQNRCSWKFFNIQRKATMLESLFNTAVFRWTLWDF